MKKQTPEELARARDLTSKIIVAPANQGWLATSTSVTPINDFVEHQAESEGCWCKPNYTEDGILVHNSMDSREQYECGERKPS